MARKDRNERQPEKKKSRHQGSAQNSPKASSRTSRSAAPEKEPWTPWGKWLKRRRQRRERKRLERQERRRKRRQARQRRWARRRLITTRGVVFVGLMVLACSVAGIILLILGRPYPWEAIGEVQEVVAITRRIDENQQRWQSLSVDHYQVEIEYQDNMDTWCGPVLIDVRGGVVRDQPTPRDTHWFPLDRCNDLLDELIIDHSFDWLNRRVDEFQPGETYLDIQFDAAFGYPVFAEAGVYDEDDAEPGCCWTVRWGRFQPIYGEDNDN